MRDFLSGRQNLIPEAPTDELNAILGALADAFGEAWLKGGANAPLQKLWQRDDGLATNQLFLIGDAIKTLSARHPDWTARQVKTIKSADANNRRGAMFELLGLNVFTGHGLDVAPTGRDAPGFDGVIDFGASNELALSLKSHGPSSHETAVKTQAAKIERDLVAALGRQSKSGWSFVVVAGRYPSDADWSALRKEIQPLLANMPDRHVIQIDGWKVAIDRLALAPGEKITERPPSYKFLLVAPHHKNEQQNLESKLDAARANLVAHAGEVSAPRRGILMRLHEGASPATCVRWVQAYLQDRPDSPLDVVFLYQAAVTQNIEAGTSGIAHTLAPVMTPAFQRWLQETGKRLSFQFRVGTANDSPSKLMLMSDHGHELDLDTAYAYQRGEIHDLYEPDGSGVINAYVRNPVSGVLHHAITRSPSIGGEMELRGKFPPTHDLTMFD